ncbi:TonB family protein [Rudaea sp.]|uniref:TonB family protein n=1 Tax=Rudaea sp. TaxID=2136325 RepID=UPI002ED20A58
MTHELLMALGRGALVASLALALVLAVRVPARRRLGAAFAYRLWLLVPIAASATLLPAPARPLIPALQVASSAPSSSTTIELQAAVTQQASFDWQPWLLALWIAGALALVVVFVRQQRRYLKNLGALSAGDHGALRAQATDGCPALVGALRPRIVVPSDFESRYTQQERELVLVHERTHLARGDAQINALAALLRCLNWFNPLFHLAASRFRFDQEIACDAAVMSRFPEARRCYADAMLKAQLVGRSRQELRLPAGCHWPQSHPLKERIAMLKFSKLSTRRHALAGGVSVALILGAGYAAWAAQPSRAPAAEVVDVKNTPDVVDTKNTQSAQADRIKIDLPPLLDKPPPLENPPAPITLSVSSSGNYYWNDTLMGEDQLREAMAAAAKKNPQSELRIQVDKTANYQLVAAAVKDAKNAGITRIGFQPPRGGVDGADTGPTEDLNYRRMYPPKYPVEAVRNRITGKVMLKVTVDKRGVPTAAEVESVKPEESARVLADAAIATAMKWRFNPAIKDGAPAGGSVKVPVDFVLSDDNGNPMPPPDPVSDVNVSYRKMRPPVYPRDAIAAKVSGALYVRAHIDADGSVADAYVDQAVPVSALALKESALAAVKAWQFNPQTHNGTPVESDVLVPMQFRIEGDAAAQTNAPAPAYPDSVKRLEAIVVTGSAS